MSFTINKAAEKLFCLSPSFALNHTCRYINADDGVCPTFVRQIKIPCWKTGKYSQLNDKWTRSCQMYTDETEQELLSFRTLDACYQPGRFEHSSLVVSYPKSARDVSWVGSFILKCISRILFILCSILCQICSIFQTLWEVSLSVLNILI